MQRLKTGRGSCSPRTGHMRLNIELARKPHHCLEYMIVHELVHLVEPTYNARFVALMAQYMLGWHATATSSTVCQCATRTGGIEEAVCAERNGIAGFPTYARAASVVVRASWIARFASRVAARGMALSYLPLDPVVRLARGFVPSTSDFCLAGVFALGVVGCPMRAIVSSCISRN